LRVHRVVTDPSPGLSALAELVDPEHPEDLEELIALRNETDEVARSVAIEMLSLVAPEDRYVGPHAAVVMAPFMWRSASRFSPGTFGVLYTATSLDTAVREAAYHASAVISASVNSPPGRVPRIALILELDDSRHLDCRWIADSAVPGGRRAPDGIDPRIYDAANYSRAQHLGAELVSSDREGVRYSSVRDPAGECFGTMRPAAVQTVYDEVTTVELTWDGARVPEYRVLHTHSL
jgi:hypothetical protein